MIESINIQGYRGLQHFDMDDLRRINLLVGTNNSGKTSILEALHLLNSRGDPTSLWQLLWRRGERLLAERTPNRQNLEIDICHLFHGHEIGPGAKFTLSAKNQTPERFVSFKIAEPTKDQIELFDPRELGGIPRYGLQITGSPLPVVGMLPLSRNGGIQAESFEMAPRRMRRKASHESPSQFITPESIDADDLIFMWDKISLSPDEELVLTALKILDPDITRVAAIASSTYYPTLSRGGFNILRQGNEQRIPIGSLGDGMWRILAMAIAITQCKGGLLLVDEIDTGLHYTVMSNMWRLVYQAAREFDVQVFATTHSYDCVQSLAHVCMSESHKQDIVTLQRIEPGKQHPVPYSEAEIRVAAERHVEVR